MTKSKSSDWEQIIAIVVILAVFGYYFRHQIISWFQHAIISALEAIFLFLVQIALPLGLGALLAYCLSERQIIYSNRNFWGAIILCILGLIGLSYTNIGNGIGAFLAVFVFGILGYLGYELLRDTV